MSRRVMREKLVGEREGEGGGGDMQRRSEDMDMESGGEKGGSRMGRAAREVALMVFTRPPPL